MKNRTKDLLILTSFFILIWFFFIDLWDGVSAIQGIDGNYSIRVMLKRMLLEGRDGLWNSYYWLGNGRGWMINTKLLFLKLFPAQWNLTACFSFTMYLAMSGTYLFVRKLSFPRWASYFSALSYGFAPHFITLVYPCHIDSYCLMAYVPWIFYFLTVVLNGEHSGRKVWLAIAGAGFAWGMVLNEDVQRGLYISVIAAGYTIFLLGSTGKHRPFSAKIGLLSFAKVLAVGAFALVVFLNNFSLQFGSPRVQGKQAGVSDQQGKQAEEQQWKFATSWSLNPKELGDSFAPGFHGMASGDPDRPYWGDRPIAHNNNSMGYFIVIFGLAGIITAFRTSGIVRFFSLSALLALLLAFGEYMPGKPLYWLWYHLPLMSKMRAPVKFMSVVAFCLSVLGAFGFQHLFMALKTHDRKLLKCWAITFAVLLASGLFWFIWVGVNEKDITAEALKRVGQPALAAKAYRGAIHALLLMNLYSVIGLGLLGMALFLKKYRHTMAVCLIGFTVLMVWDVFSINRFYLKRSIFNPTEFYVQNPMINFLKQQPGNFRACTSFKIMHQGRMVPLSLAANRGMYVTHLFPYHGVESMDSTPRSRVARDYNKFFKSNLPELPRGRSPNAVLKTLLDGQINFWHLSNVKYIVTDGFLYGISQQPLPVFDAMKQHAGLTLAWTGAGMGGRPVAVFEVQNVLPRFSVFQGEAGNILSSSFNEPEVTKMSGSDIRLTINEENNSTLIWSSAFDENWKISINGKPVKAFPVKDLLTGIPVPAGRNEILLRFSPEKGLKKLSQAFIVLGVLMSGFWFLLTLFVERKETVGNDE